MSRKIILKGDLHIHTDCSLTLPISKKPHVLYSPTQAVRQAVKVGLDFLAITDHDSIEGVEKAQKEAKRIFQKTGKRILVIPGEEVTTSRFHFFGHRVPLPGPHLLAYGIKTRIPPFLSIQETIERIHAQGGLAVAAHPFHRRFISIGEKAALFPLDGLEVYNASDWVKEDQKARKFAKKLKMKEFGGSDAHLLEVIGAGLTIVESDSSVKKWQDILRLIMEGKGKVVPNGKGRKIMKKTDVVKGLLGVYERAN